MAPSSRRRYTEYLEKRRAALRDRKANPVAFVSEDQRKKLRRHRSFVVLLREIWSMLAGRRPLILGAMATQTIQASLVLLIPACTKVAIDYIITDHPGPAGLPRWIPVAEGLRDPANRMTLLWMLGAFMLSITLVRIVVGMWGRWQITRPTKQMQMSLRRDVFEHAARLP